MPAKKSLTRRSTAAVDELIERRIYLLRGQRVMLDSDLASLYEVETRTFNQAVRRNRERFPEDFMFRLTPDETESLRSQFVISNIGDDSNVEGDSSGS
jgi:ORF6N domain